MTKSTSLVAAFISSALWTFLVLCAGAYFKMRAEQGDPILLMASPPQWLRYLVVYSAYASGPAFIAMFCTRARDVFIVAVAAVTGILAPMLLTIATGISKPHEWVGDGSLGAFVEALSIHFSCVLGAGLITWYLTGRLLIPLYQRITGSDADLPRCKSV